MAKTGNKMYSKEKINITVNTKFLKRIDKIKKYPRWEDNRSSVIGTAIEEFLSSEPQESKCIYCGCTDSHACPDGCYWVIVDRINKKGLCSTCQIDKKADVFTIIRKLIEIYHLTGQDNVESFEDGNELTITKLKK